MSQKIRDRLARAWSALKPWLIARLREPSTYFGIICKVGGAAGYEFTDGTAAHIASLLAVLAGVVLFAYDEAPKPDPSDEAGA